MFKFHVYSYRLPFRAMTSHPVAAESEVAVDDLLTQRTHDDVAPLPDVIGCRRLPTVTSRRAECVTSRQSMTDLSAGRGLNGRAAELGVPRHDGVTSLTVTSLV